LLGDLPGLSGGAKIPQENSGFDDFDFEEDESPPPQKQTNKARDKFSAAQAALDDFEKEE
jgi:hypothetical protein